MSSYNENDYEDYDHIYSDENEPFDLYYHGSEEAKRTHEMKKINRANMEALDKHINEWRINDVKKLTQVIDYQEAVVIRELMNNHRKTEIKILLRQDKTIEDAHALIETVDCNEALFILQAVNKIREVNKFDDMLKQVDIMRLEDSKKWWSFSIFG